MKPARLARTVAPAQLWRRAGMLRNNYVFGVLGLGEGWHTTHHAFPTSASHGLRWWQPDLSYYVIRALAWLCLAWDVRLPTQEAQAKGRG